MTKNATRFTFDFDTTEFEFSHGRAPRGRGMWAFAGSRDPRMPEEDPVTDPVTAVFWTPLPCTFAEAKSLARLHFMRVCKEHNLPGHHTLFVLP